MNPQEESNPPQPAVELSPMPTTPVVPVPPPLIPLPPAAPPMPSPTPADMTAAPAQQTIPAPTAPPANALRQLQSSVIDAPVPAPIADEDNLVLDKEWIEKAKHIVEETAADPYEQNRRLAEVKADYLQKRYAKTIKLAE